MQFVAVGSLKKSSTTDEGCSNLKGCCEKGRDGQIWRRAVVSGVCTGEERSNDDSGMKRRYGRWRKMMTAVMLAKSDLEGHELSRCRRSLAVSPKGLGSCDVIGWLYHKSKSFLPFLAWRLHNNGVIFASSRRFLPNRALPRIQEKDNALPRRFPGGFTACPLESGRLDLIRDFLMAASALLSVSKKLIAIWLSCVPAVLESRYIGNCPHHQRSVAASLVQGAYVLERDRQLNRQEACAPPWWERFHFEVTRKLIDDADLSIFGAIYKFKPPTNSHGSTVPNPPKFVIVFRGTVTKKESLSRDLKLDLQVLKNHLHQTSRFMIAMQAVRSLVAAFGHQHVWLAGHSLGAAMATLAGKTMAKEGMHLKAFLFNPPFFSAPIERIKNWKVKHGIRIAGSVVTAGLALALKGPSHKCNSFTMLSAWVPCLFVNKSDDICSEYIGYFEHRKKMEEIGAGNIEKLATKNSMKDLFLSAFGVESESLHLLPSANLTVNSSPSPDFKSAHGIHQWWRSDLDCQTKVYLYE
ncbi:hypothetical protein ZIOFF_048377 [Zingiber officinale]|uniref:Fungal lipase-type domain-containing protein n=1 Tax=Zingiber officinale TaxID=94328 RepID=A0A8J5FSA4_ZINOF|nr:hypothetical protein ZIOFF_048377 [Zingiber officinale]